MGTRVLSLWMPYMEVDRLGQDRDSRSRSSGRTPRATCLDERETSPLMAICSLAERAGLVPGMQRAEALKLVPGLDLHVGAPETRPAVFEDMRDMVRALYAFCRDRSEHCPDKREARSGWISGGRLTFQAAKPIFLSTF